MYSIYLDDFRFARYLYDLLPEQDKKSLSLSGDTTFDEDIYVVVRVCQNEGFIELTDGEDGFLYIAIAVLPEYRGKGIADILLNRALTYADKPVRYVTRKDNATSLGFINKRNDFRLVEDNSTAFVYEQVAKWKPEVGEYYWMAYFYEDGTPDAIEDIWLGLKEDYRRYKGNGIFKTRKEAYALAKELSEADKND